MQDQNLNLNSARLDDLVNTISEARRSLQNWQDKRTEALIRLDAFSFDIKQIEEERAKTNQKIQELKNEALTQAKIYQSHVSELTDQMQLLKLEAENLRNEVLDKKFVIESLEKEIETQKTFRAQAIEQHAIKQNELKLELENQFSQQIWELKSNNETVSAQFFEAARKCALAEARATRLEQEISQIRSHMLGVLQTNPADRVSEAVSVKFAPKTDLETQNIQAISESDAPTVDEYLKRLGY